MTTTKNQTYTFNLLLVVLIVFTLYILKPVVVPLLISAILSVAVFPLVRFLEVRLKFNRLFSSLMAIILLVIVVVFLVIFIGYQLSDIITKSDTYIHKLNEVYQNGMHEFERRMNIRKNELSGSQFNLGKAIKNNVDSIMYFVTASGSILSDVILIPLYMFFFLLYRKFFKSFIFKVFAKEGNSNKIKTIMTKLYEVQINYLFGLFTVMGIVGIMNSIGLLALGIENPFFYGFFAAFLLLIPYIGILIGSIIPALIALVTKDSAWYSVGVMLVFMFIQFLEGNFITPKITGSKVSINSLVSIISLIVFSMLWGIAGMVLALPITASLKILFDSHAPLRPYGFLLGEPNDLYLNSSARMRLKNWKKIREAKRKAALDFEKRHQYSS